MNTIDKVLVFSLSVIGFVSVVDALYLMGEIARVIK